MSNLSSEDRRCVLAKLIFEMTADQQAAFREKFPPGIPDRNVDAAIKYAESMNP
jgi:hypothetical protein